MADNWNWHDEESSDLTVIRRVHAIAVYTNPSGDIVIRQESDDGPQADPVIVVPKSQLDNFIHALRKEAAEI